MPSGGSVSLTPGTPISRIRSDGGVVPVSSVTFSLVTTAISTPPSSGVNSGFRSFTVTTRWTVTSNWPASIARTGLHLRSLVAGLLQPAEGR